MIKNNHDLTYSDYFTFKDLDKNFESIETLYGVGYRYIKE